MHRQTRIGRYHGSGSWPPALDVILREVHRVYRRRGYFNDPKEFRGVCTSADSTYTKGAADDCMRLLKDAGVLIPWKVDDKTHLLIGAGARQDLVTRFKQGLSPDFPSRDELTRRARMLLKSLRKRSASSKRTTKPAIAPVATSVSPAAAALLEPSVASFHPTEIPMIATAPVPVVASPVPVPRFVAYLPPGAAREVWLFLYVCVTRLTDFDTRIAVPNLGVPDGVECSAQDFDDWLEVFQLAGVIECEWEAGANNRLVAFKIHPDEIHTVEIKERRPTKVARIWIDVANRARREIDREQFTSARLRNQLATWVEAHFPALLGLTASQKLMGYRLDATRTDTNWGIFFKDPSRDVYLSCLPGLEPFEFVPTDFVARRCKRKGKSAPMSVAEPAPEPVIESAQVREPEPVPALEPLSAPAPIATTLLIENVRAWIDEERRHLNEAERLITELASRKQRRTQLAAELEALDTQIAADRARLEALGIEF